MVTAADLVFHITGGQTGATNTNPFESLGGQMAAIILSDRMENLWDHVSEAQRAEGITEYRWIVLENKATDTLVHPRFYFKPKDPYVEIEFSRLALGAAVGVLETEDIRPPDVEIGPEEDVPMPFTKTTEDYNTTGSIGPDMPPGSKLYICVRRQIPEDAPKETRAYVLVVEGSPSV